MIEKEDCNQGDSMMTFSEESPREEEGGRDENKRENWGKRLDYLMSMIGFSVGFGNLWRFPYICSRNGGGAFLIPFLVVLVLVGFPLYFLEASFSQFSGKNAIQVWSFCPMLKGNGIASTIMNLAFTTYYGVMLAWPIYYMVMACSKVLPWTTCDNSWNTPLCVGDTGSSYSNFSVLQNANATNQTIQENIFRNISRQDLWENRTLAHTSTEEFWQYRVLAISGGIDQVGFVKWEMVGCMLAGYVIVVLILIKGIKSIEKVVYVTVTLPYLLLIVIFIRSLMQPGAFSGVVAFFKPDFKKLLEIQVWLEAYMQVSFSLGPGWGVVGTPSSYKKFHEPCLRDTIIIVAVAEGTSILAGMVTFSVLGTMAESIGVAIADVVSSGPGFAFITYVHALSQLPLPQLWSFLFFLALLTVGLDSQFLSIEVLVTAIIDWHPRLLRRRRTLATVTLCIGCFLVGILYCTQAGVYFIQLLDWYIAAIAGYVVCVVECIAAAWIYGVRQMSVDINMMIGRPLPFIIKLGLAIIAPVVIMVALIMTLIQYQPPTYGKYKYPPYASAIGWVLAALPLIPVPLLMFKAIRRFTKTHSLKKSFVLALRPDKFWQPSSEEHRSEHRQILLKREHSFQSRARDVFQL